MIGLIYNPKAYKNKGREGSLLKNLLGKNYGDIIFRLTSNVRDTPRIVEEFLKRKIDLICVSGGDGTLQRTMNELIAKGDGNIPTISPLKGGSTNVMSNILGYKGQDKTLKKIIGNYK